MATTTNYGWTTPDDTALVKDGASAIRTLGSSVDTTTKALNPETTLGDLAYRSSTANVKTRLGLGTAGQVLQVNSGATAPEWATAAGGGANWSLLNSGGTSLSGTSTSITGISGQDKLMILVKGASHGSAFDYNLEIQFNTNTGSVYTQQGFQIVGQASSLTPDSLYGINTTTTAIRAAATSANATSVASAFCLITGCNSSGVKAFTASGGGDRVSTATDNRLNSIGGIFDSSATISSVQIKFGGGTFDAGTVFIYGSA
jgi:hypothetical protein